MADQVPMTEPHGSLLLTPRCRCDSCRFWAPDQIIAIPWHPPLDVPLGVCRRLALLTQPTFGCVDWDAKAQG